MTDRYELQRLSEHYYDELRAHIQYAYWPEHGPGSEYVDGTDLEVKFGEPYGFVDDGEVLALVLRYSFRARIRGEFHDLDGYSTLVIPPEHRGKGLVEEVHYESFRTSRERGVAFGAQWPFNHAFYQRYGWGRACNRMRWSCSPSTFRSVADDASGSYRRLEPSDWEVVDQVYRQHAESYALSLDRDETWWREHVFRPGNDPLHAYAWERDGVRGYLVFDVNASGGKQLNVVDVAYTDHEALVHLLRFLSNHYSKIDRITMTLPFDESLLDLIDDPNSLECSVLPGPLVRLTDVPVALETLAYPPNVEGSVTLRVTDPVCDWNDGTYDLSVADGSATCRPTSDDPDVTIGVGTLSQLVVGYRELESLERSGNLTVHDADATETLSTSFPSRAVFLRDHF